MPTKHNTPPPKPNATLGEAATQFLSIVPPDAKVEMQREVFKFIRWFGEDRPIISISGQEAANYTEHFYSSPLQSPDHLLMVKKLLTYAQKQGLTSSNLGAHIRIKKIALKNLPATSKVEEPVILTKQGFEELKNKLSELKNERPRIAEELRKAAADKDFRENAPLEAMREKQGHLEGQIRELEDTLKRASVVETESEKGVKVAIGNTVLLEDTINGERMSFTLVGPREANVKQGKISIVSPMGQVLFNRESGDTVNVSAPSGTITYKILDIKQSD